MASTYPDRRLTDQFRKENFSPSELNRWAELKREETIRINQIKDERFLEIEKSEAESKWNFAHSVIESGQARGLYTLNNAKWDLLLSCHRYWTSLEALKHARKRMSFKQSWQFWVMLFLTLIAAIAAILALLPYFRK